MEGRPFQLLLGFETPPVADCSLLQTHSSVHLIVLFQFDGEAGFPTTNHGLKEDSSLEVPYEFFCRKRHEPPCAAALLVSKRWVFLVSFEIPRDSLSLWSHLLSVSLLELL